jgi:nucleotide-binding universal stress UspA family protein
MSTSIDHRAQPTSIILVGVDLSAASHHVVEVASQLARATPGSELHLVHGSPLPMSTHELRELFAQSNSDFGGTIMKAREELDRLVASTAAGISRVTGHIRIGDAANGIIELARELSADLVVVGASHRGGVARALLGSVAEKVSRKAPCPVLLVREKSIPVWEQIEPPCPECIEARRASQGTKLWCARHSERHPRPHVHYERPDSYGVGSLTFREI